MHITNFEFNEEEINKTLDIFFENGVLKSIPKKEKRKMIIFLEFIKYFQTGKYYSEGEINEIIKEKYLDYALIRRYLVDYKLLERDKDGSSYWKSNGL